MLLLISFISILIHGYAFSTGDQAIHIPQVLSRIDLQLFAQDYSVNIPEGQFTLFYPLMVGLIKLSRVDLQWLYFGLYLLIRFLLTLAIFDLAKTILKSEAKSFLATALLSLPLPIGGTAIATFDTAFMPRLLISPALIYGLTQIIKANYFKSAFISGLIFLIHPFSAISLSLIIFGSLIFYRHHPVKIFVILLIAFITASPLILTRLPMFLFGSPGWLMPPQWHQILTDRMPYLFLSDWSIVHWLSLGLFLLPVILRLKYPLVQAVFFTTITLTLIYFIFSETIPVTFLIQLQPLRIWTFLVFLAPILLVDLDFRLALVTLILLIFIKLPSSFKLELPHQNQREWDQLQLWIRDNTSKDSLILTPPHRNGFRIHSKRAIVAEIKDGSSGLYSYPFALEWQRRISQLHPLPTKSTPEISRIARQYGADYLVTFADFPHSSFTPVFQTKNFIIYQL
ncbi:MAG: hypothetical protein A2784_04175 [Candidatus Chisholmbacteria bacterium RIFCSPHIGHO2_01_FULL_48_12]|uniref:DUF6798 domain-containing protein n=1 Tax=Candidatus Chisholmbacteria bacterium RIFCSPHIGHO2_01_FULL_48_12 TaxID=1797589 RepID=A0A1G1VNN1_9BACT|nr:MAG: hypothetical protein A2784_04175 [Candidatus Chisholmbacteria bacterium RIFCSPHIGHO2_01_FULL_48_12]